MMTRILSRSCIAILSLMLMVGVQAQAQDEGQDRGRVKGRITAVQGSQIEVQHRDGSASTIHTTGQTRYLRNGQPATLEDFQTGDYVTARGRQNGNGAFTAAAVRGGTRQPPQRDKIAGTITAVDGSAGTISVATRDGDSETVYTTAETKIMRDRVEVGLGDLVAGDRVTVMGQRDPDGNLVAVRVLSASPR
jgi:hypothetical protein